MSSLVFPAGKSRGQSWLDRLNADVEEKEGVVKTASTEQEVEEAPIGTAAIPMEELQRLAQLGGFPEVEVEVEEALPAPPGEEPVPEGEEVAVSDEAPMEESEDPVTEAAEAVADAQDALADASEALADAGAEIGGDELIEEGIEEEIEIPVDIEVEEVEEDEEDLECDKMKKSEDVPEVAEASSDEKEKTASVESTGRFVKVAELSPTNRKKLSDYWVKTLGYDADWVKQMLQDYN
jgi:hypothetical protein